MKTENPPEKAFTRFPQWLHNALLVLQLSKNELKILLLVARLTYGCHKKEAIIPSSKFKCIGICPSHLSLPIKSLVTRGFIHHDSTTHTYSLVEDKLIHDSKIQEKKLEGLNNLIHISLSQKGNKSIPQTDLSTFPNRTADIPKTGMLKDYAMPHERTNLNPKDSAKDSIKDSDKEKTIADLKSSFIADPSSFKPANNEQFVALEAWKALEPDKPESFGLYLSAVKDIPAHFILQFVKEILADQNVKNRGATFASKVISYRLSHRK